MVIKEMWLDIEKLEKAGINYEKLCKNCPQFLNYGWCSLKNESTEKNDSCASFGHSVV